VISFRVCDKKKDITSYAYYIKNKNTLLAQSAYAWLPFVETMRTEYLNYSPHKLKEIRDLVDTYEAGEIELTE
jgi:dissimilatory sulfite reductase (desulfoviridin) alpha/beta subunit